MSLAVNNGSQQWLIEGVIFDLDNTLVGSQLNFADLRVQVGCPLAQDMLQFIAAIDDPVRRQWAEQLVVDHELADVAHALWLPGAQMLVAALHRANIPQAIVTRNCQQATQLKMAHNNIMIDTVITRGSAFAPKPDPAALLHIAKQWQIAPQRICYVGDYLYDIQAADNAGMVSCLITNGIDKPYQQQAKWCYDDLQQLLAQLIPEQPPL